MPSPLLIFDLDGTLVDTAPDLVGTLNAILARRQLPPIPFAEARATIGGGARTMIERALRRLQVEVPAEEIDRLFAAFIDHYAANIAEGSRPYPGLVPALDRLRERGCRFAVCTNKLEWLARRLLDALAMTERFAFICGQDTFGVRKPDPEVLLRTIAGARGDRDAAIMVGDSATDIDVARAARVPVIAVDFGYTEIPVTALGPDIVISHFDQIDRAVARLQTSGVVS